MDKWICKDYSNITNITGKFRIKTIVIYLDCEAKEATRRYNDRVNTPNRHLGLSITNKYPFEEGKSEIGYISLEEMEKRYKLYEDKSFGDYRLVVSTNNSEEITQVYEKIKQFIINIVY